MNLPALSSQHAYGHLAWTLVLAAFALALLAWRFGPQRQHVVPVLLATVLAISLPGPWSPGHWLGLAFQLPSAFGAALCAVSIEARWSGRTDRPTLPLPVAATLAAAGGLLYLDASGWLARGFYAAGFGPVGAPVTGLLMAGLAVAGLATGRFRAQSIALFVAVLAFALCRLPTGNLWDALVDPFLWLWSVVVVLRHVPRFVPRRRRAKPAVEASATAL